MSRKITLSYQTEYELEEVKTLLSSITAKVKLQPSKGTYRRAYITLKDNVQTLQNRDK